MVVVPGTGLGNRRGERFEWLCTGEEMLSVDGCRARFVWELGQLRAQFPDESVLIGSYGVVADGDDDMVFGLLIGLVGPSAPRCADALWGCVSGFLRGLRRVEMFREPMQLRRPARGRYSRYTPPSVRPVIRL